MKNIICVALFLIPCAANAQEAWRVVENVPEAALAVQSVNGSTPKQAIVGYFFTAPTDTHANGDLADYTLVGMEFDCYSPQTRALAQKNYRVGQSQPVMVGQAIGSWERVVHPSQQKVWESVCGVKDHAVQRFDTPAEIIKWLRRTK